MVDLDKPMLPVEAVRPIGSFGILGRVEAYRVQCPLHGSWMFPPGIVRTARSFAISHAACVAPAPEMERRGRAARPPARKSRLRAVSILSVPLAPAALEVAVEPPADASWLTFENQGVSLSARTRS